MAIRDARAMSYGASHNRYAAIAVEFDVNLLDQVTGSTEVDAVTRHADNRTVLDGNVVFDGANPVIKKIWTWKGVAVWATGSQSPHLTLEKPLRLPMAKELWSQKTEAPPLPVMVLLLLPEPGIGVKSPMEIR